MAYKLWALNGRRLLTLLALMALSTSALAQGYQWRTWPAGQAQPDFSAPDLSGRVWRLPELKGRAVLINFWASWCEPCIAEMPSLQTLAQRHTGSLVVLAVNFKQSVPAIDSFVQRTGLILPVLADPQGLLARQWGIRIFPSTVVIDAQGRARGVVQGELDWAGSAAQMLLQPVLPKSH